MPEILSSRALNRAALARQMLLEREPISALEAFERLLALQAQEARPPFFALWSRVCGFAREDLSAAVQDRAVVRATAFRGTLHLMTAGDYLAFRPALHSALKAGLESILDERARGLDLDSLPDRALAHLAEEPLTFETLRERLSSNYPTADARALGYSVRMLLPLIQVPSGGEWAYSPGGAFTPARSWLGRDVSVAERTEEIIVRYLAAFGPASVADAESWTGMRALKSGFEALRPRLLTFQDQRKRELFDLPDAPRPPEETPAPVRFLPEFDNLLLSYAERSRVISDANRKRIYTRNLRIPATFLVDGSVAGAWKLEAKRRAVTLTIEPFDEIPERARDELVSEGEALLVFAAGGGTVQFAA